MLPNYLANIKSSGIYRFVFDKSEMPGQEAETLRLVIGYSEKGPFNTPVYVTTEDEFKKIYGGTSKKMERYGMWFHRMALQALKAGPILAFNVKNFEDAPEGTNKVDFTTFNPNNSIFVEDEMGEIVDERLHMAIKDLYNTDRFWTLEPEQLEEYVNDNIDKPGYITIATTDSKETSVTIFMRGYDPKGFDVPFSEWYSAVLNGEEIPTYLEGHERDLVSQYFAELFIFNGEFTPEIAASDKLAKFFDVHDVHGKDVRLKPYIVNAFGEKIDTLDALASNDASNFVKKYSGILLPDFRNANNVVISLDAQVNADNYVHKLLMRFNQDMLYSIVLPTENDPGSEFQITDLDTTGWVKGPVLEDSDKRMMSIDGVEPIIFNVTFDPEYVNPKDPTDIGKWDYDEGEHVGENPDYYKFDFHGEDKPTTSETSPFAMVFDNVDQRFGKAGIREGDCIFIGKLAHVVKIDSENIEAQPATEDTWEFEGKPYDHAPEVENTPESWIIDGDDENPVYEAPVVAPVTVETPYWTIGDDPTKLDENPLHRSIIDWDGNIAQSGPGTAPNANYQIVGNENYGIIVSGELEADAAHPFDGGTSYRFGVAIKFDNQMDITDATWSINGNNMGYVEDKIAQFDPILGGDAIYLYPAYKNIETGEHAGKLHFGGEKAWYRDGNDPQYVPIDGETLEIEIQYANGVTEKFEVMYTENGGSIPQSLPYTGSNVTSGVDTETDHWTINGEGNYPTEDDANDAIEHIAEHWTVEENDGIWFEDPRLETSEHHITFTPAHEATDAHKRYTVHVDIPVAGEGSEDIDLEYIYKCVGSVTSTSRNLKPCYMKGYIYGNPKPESTKQMAKRTWQEYMLKALTNYRGLRIALTSRVDLEYRYLVDTFESFVGAECKAILSTLCKEKDNAFAILNFPQMKNFSKCDYISFRNEKNEFDTKYIPMGGNPLKPMAGMFTLPSQENGASWCGFFTCLKIRDVNTGVKEDVPAAALVSNNFMKKYTTYLPYTIIAGTNRGVIRETGLLGPDFNFGREDLDNLEPFGVNCMVYVDRKGTVINSNQTAKQNPVTTLSKINVRELVIFLQDEIEKMMLDYHWDFNTPNLQQRIKDRADVILETAKNNGGVYIYRNQCDKYNNTDDVINNEMIVLSTSIEPGMGAGKMVQELYIYRKGGMSSALVSDTGA